ncbi:hypothetical protein RFI_28035, partial [Reticulomyxa filosa]
MDMTKANRKVHTTLYLEEVSKAVNSCAFYSDIACGRILYRSLLTSQLSLRKFSKLANNLLHLLDKQPPPVLRHMANDKYAVTSEEVLTLWPFYPAQSFMNKAFRIFAKSHDLDRIHFWWVTLAAVNNHNKQTFRDDTTRISFRLVADASTFCITCSMYLAHITQLLQTTTDYNSIYIHSQLSSSLPSSLPSSSSLSSSLSSSSFSVVEWNWELAKALLQVRFPSQYKNGNADTTNKDINHKNYTLEIQKACKYWKQLLDLIQTTSHYSHFSHIHGYRDSNTILYGTSKILQFLLHHILKPLRQSNMCSQQDKDLCNDLLFNYIKLLHFVCRKWNILLPLSQIQQVHANLDNPDHQSWVSFFCLSVFIIIIN